VVLFLALGWAARHYLTFDALLPLGAIAGLLVARLVPARSCGGKRGPTGA
jgi:hypothetical protein